MDNNNKVGFSFVVEKQLFKQFKLICIENDSTPTDEIRKFIREYVEYTQVNNSGA